MPNQLAHLQSEAGESHLYSGTCTSTDGFLLTANDRKSYCALDPALILSGAVCGFDRCHFQTKVFRRKYVILLALPNYHNNSQCS